ncbi:MAG: hypothetical protein HPY57_14190 [Ignavibacteria bacterium]|nr:hypothetical protein [Ignavibacteria bacterium]
MEKYRVFTNVLGWSDVIYIFDINTTFAEIRNNPKTKYLDKRNFLGVYEFDKNFLSLFNIGNIFGKNYYYKFMFMKDDIPQEEKQWRSIPDFTIINKKQDTDDSLDVSQSLF